VQLQGVGITESLAQRSASNGPRRAQLKEVYLEINFWLFCDVTHTSVARDMLVSCRVYRR